MHEYQVFSFGLPGKMMFAYGPEYCVRASRLQAVMQLNNHAFGNLQPVRIAHEYFFLASFDVYFQNVNGG